MWIDRTVPHGVKKVGRIPYNSAKKRMKNLDTQPVVIYKYRTKV
jgi:hypothetical protein